MAKLRGHNLAVSLDGYLAGPNQGLENPLGEGGEGLHAWAFETRVGRGVHGMEGGEEGVDNDYLAAGVTGIGATIMGRNMFAPRDAGDEWREWQGWWGENPPFHHPVFVLTHQERQPLELEGGTTFHFVTDGIEAALAQAFEAAGGLDVRLGGGASTVRQYLRAGLVDELHVAVVPLLLGEGERLLCSGDLDAYECVEYVPSPAVAHMKLAKTKER